MDDISAMGDIGDICDMGDRSDLDNVGDMGTLGFTWVHLDSLGLICDRMGSIRLCWGQFGSL